MNRAGSPRFAPEGVRDQLRARGLRWTPQRRAILEVVARAEGHVSGSELIDRCRRIDPDVTPSTVYRTLDTLETLGLVTHSHGVGGREEYHVAAEAEHGHLVCESCGTTWELDDSEIAGLRDVLDQARGFAMIVSHLAIVGRCAQCRAAAAGKD